MINILTLIGSLGLFLFGMKVMSEALQKVAGIRMRTFLAATTANRFRGILTGFVLTALLQSSSATTVMIVSFVNAGLISLIESIGLIIGANIGTTITGWLVSLIGFNLKMGNLVIPLVGLGFPLLFSSNSTRKSWGEFIIGFALIFIGLEYLKETVPDISARPQLVEFLGNYTGRGIQFNLLFLLIGIGLTILIQSSSASMALTFVMCYHGWIHFELAAAMVLGENIGTTITANFAALVANRPGKRAALSHLYFNLIGVIWALPLLGPSLHLVERIMLQLGNPSPFETIDSIPLALATYHTGFNIINAALLAGFFRQIERLTLLTIRSQNDLHIPYRLKYFKTGLLSTSELSIYQARKEISLFARRTHKMFRMVRSLFSETNEDSFLRYLGRIERYEEICDNMEVEIATYLMKISESDLSQQGTKRLKAMLSMVDAIEDIGDGCNLMAHSVNRKKSEKIWFSQDIRDNLNQLFDILEEAFDEMLNNLEMDYSLVDLSRAREIEDRINRLRDQLKQQHLSNIEKQNYKYQAGVVYSDMINQAERIGDVIFSVSLTLRES